MTKKTEKGSYEVDWKKLREVVKIATRFLDNVIDANSFPLPQIESMTLRTRKIGLGVMGWAELLFKLEIPYDSDEALDLARKIMEYINYHSKIASVELARERGAPQAFRGSIYNSKNAKLPFESDDEVKHYTLDWSNVRKKIKTNGIRNMTTTTIAPTGTISIIAGTSSGIEPLFALSFMRNVMGKTRLFEIDQVFEEKIREYGLYSEELVRKIAQVGTLKNIPEIPKKLRRVFVTALEIDPEWHVKMQAAFQEFTDNATSKTVNLNYDATPEDVRKIYLLAYDLKCKGITIYRYGSKGEQVLYIGKQIQDQTKAQSRRKEESIEIESSITEGCPRDSCKL
jgi:ribonucleoside-diphosphate reductase alpha chain